MCQHNLITYSIICRFPGKRDWHWIEAPGIGFEVVYVAGPDAAPLFDLEPARRIIGFEPRDRFPEGIGFETCFRLYKVFRYLLEGA